MNPREMTTLMPERNRSPPRGRSPGGGRHRRPAHGIELGPGGRCSRRESALGRVHAQGPSPDQPPPIGILGEVMLGRLVAEVPQAARQLMEAWWPGPLTLVLPARPGLPQWIAPEGHVGVRESPHRVVRALLGAYGRPFTLTSANYSGAPPAMRSADLPAGVDLILQGNAGGGAPSTIARVAADGKITILRRGPISL